MSEPLVIIGNGMAAARLCEELLQRALGRYAIAVIGEEPRLAYNRVLLSSVLAGDVPASEIVLKSASWWRDRGVSHLCRLIWCAMVGLVQSQAALQAEILVLRHQVNVLPRDRRC